MRKPISVLVALFAVAMLSSVVFAQSKKMSEQAKTFRGEITNVDLTNHLFTVKGKINGKVTEMEFRVGADSRIMIDDTEKLLGELEKGDEVTVTYDTVSNKHMAKQVMRHKS